RAPDVVVVVAFGAVVAVVEGLGVLADAGFDPVVVVVDFSAGFCVVAVVFVSLAVLFVSLAVVALAVVVVEDFARPVVDVVAGSSSVVAVVSCVPARPVVVVVGCAPLGSGTVQTSRDD